MNNLQKRENKAQMTGFSSTCGGQLATDLVNLGVSGSLNEDDLIAFSALSESCPPFTLWRRKKKKESWKASHTLWSLFWAMFFTRWNRVSILIDTGNGRRQDWKRFLILKFHLHLHTVERWLIKINCKLRQTGKYSDKIRTLLREIVHHLTWWLRGERRIYDY